MDFVLERLQEVDALAIGPGLSRDEETAGFVRELVRACPVPFVLDADGVNAFAGRADDLADRKAEVVLTPHAGEFARLSGVTARELADDRLRHARALAATTGGVILLKGSRTLVATSDGIVRVNPTGGPVLATAGSGDVLTGSSEGCSLVTSRLRTRPPRAPTCTDWRGSSRAGCSARGRSPPISRRESPRPSIGCGRTRDACASHAGRGGSRRDPP